MLRSLFSGVSGLRAHQQMMDVVGNNISNVNTVGFKSSRVVFQDTLSQMLAGASEPSDNKGGVNPTQIGTGTRVGAVDTVMTQGSTQLTGRIGDVAIQGEGFFGVRQGQEILFTRAGAFNFDAAGNLTAPNGAVVQGWVADEQGAIDTSGPVADVKIGVGVTFPPQATTNVNLGGNLTNDANVGDVFTSSIEVIDSLGTAHRITIEFEKDPAANTWQQRVLDPAGALLGSQTLTFDGSNGALLTPATPPSFTYTPGTGADPVTFTTSYGTAGAPGALTQFGGSNSAAALSQNGTQIGSLRSVSIADDGTVTGVFSNGKTQDLARIATALFNNAAGLVKAGDSFFRPSNASGGPAFGQPSAGGRGGLAGGALESSNVDLSQEFTNLIIAQRGFQANSRIITTSDDVLQELVQLKR